MDENKTYGTRSARLWKLFLSTLYISSFTFGGGFVIVTFMKKKFVDELHWIDEQEMLDMTALAQSSPGAIAVNAAILVGWQVEGLIGMIVAVLGTIIPPMVILSVISVFYNAFATNRYIALLLKGMQAGVAAVILDVVFDLGGKVLKIRSWVYIALMVAAFVANTVFDVNVVVVILAAAVFGVVLALVFGRWITAKGVKVPTVLALVLVAVLFAVNGQVTSIAMYGVVVVILTALGNTLNLVSTNTYMSNWFPKKKGIALGWSTMGAPLSSAICIPIFTAVFGAKFRSLLMASEVRPLDRASRYLPRVMRVRIMPADSK